jgi:O-antigen ligase
MSSRRRSSSSSETGIKYAPGVGARVPPEQRPLGALEWVTLTHVAVYVVGTTWAFGGGHESLRSILAWWGSLGLLITLTALQDREAWRDGWMRPLSWLLPLVAFNALVLLASLNPSFREVKFGTDIMLVQGGERTGLPSSARPGDALHGLWLFDALWISAFNLALVIRQRRALRGLLVVAVINAGALAVFGTAQKLVNAKGLFFGTVPSPQKAFFSSFIYHNHWGSFAVLMMAACLGLVWHHARRRDTRDIYHSPAFAGLVVVLILAIAVPLSTSRSCTLLTIIILGAAYGHWIVRLVQKRLRFGESVAPPVAGAFVALALAGAAVWYFAGDTIMARVAKTQEQFETFGAEGNVDSRGQLYGDTWRMARAKPWFGWGMASYPHVFTLYNSRESKLDRLPVFYKDAHSDWLQALAEHGFIGTALLGLCGLLPLLRLRARHFSSPLPAYLLAGCGLILLYAWIEFPFGNIAVVLTWWVCFFVAVQYARLQDREAPAPVKVISPDASS